MGQQASTASSSAAHQLQRRPPPPRRTSSSQLRTTQKRSLELPEFSALLNTSTPSSPIPPTSAIPIPMATTAFQQPPSPPHRRPHYFPPSATMLHHPPPPRPQPIPVTPRYPPTQPSSHSQHHHSSSAPQHQQPRSQPQVSSTSNAHPTSSPVVRSRLPTGLPEESESLFTEADPEGGATQEATVTWRGVGKEVYLTGVADRAHERVRMHHEPGSKSTFFTTLRLPPGNHPLRFIVDEQPRCTDTLPTATDTDGTLINYIEIPSPTHSPRLGLDPQAVPGASEGGASGAGCQQFGDMEWTEDVPPRLFKLAAAEEAYLAARAAAAQQPQQSTKNGQPPQYPSLPPPPPVPYPPSLPRHLEKVILNNSSARNGPNASAFTPAILASSSSARPRIIGTGTTGPLIPTARSGVAAALAATAGQLAAPAVPVAPMMTVPGFGFGGETLTAGDDNSVLPVPNHVVLNHLGTSAIKNGVLAVGTTTRYHRKYISTIYYKPI